MTFTLCEKEKLLNLVSPILEDIERRVKFTNWDDDTIRAKFGKRSVNQILDEGEIFYFNPCIELITVFNELAYDKYFYENDITSKFVVEMQLYENREVLHFASELDWDDSKYSMHFKNRRNFEIIKGSYVNTRDDSKHLNKFKVDLRLDPNKNLNDMFKEFKLDKYLDLDKHIEKMIYDNKNPTPSTLEYIESLKNSSGFNVLFHD